jgi:hypothetical protein|tara:strand:+ start:177 stop:467 length:291 start_codon:yes stop_codon:yes gene_type:complete
MIKTFNTTEEMEMYMVESKYEISCMIVDALVEKYPISESIEIMQWSCLEDDTDYSVECHPEHVCETLEQNLDILVEEEDYKRCSAVKKILDIEYGS